MDITEMDDQEYLAECYRVRQTAAGLSARMCELNNEFMRRARLKWVVETPAGNPDLLEVSLTSFRENRMDAARWLAVEVLLLDPAGLHDDELAERLHGFQDRLEETARRMYAMLEHELP